MKKFPDYKTAKWDKRRDMILQGMHYDYEELESLNNDYLNGKINEVKYHLLLSLCFSRIARNEFIQGRQQECYICVSKQLDEFALAVQRLQEGKMHRQLQKGILKAILNPYIMAVQHFLFPTMM